MTANNRLSMNPWDDDGLESNEPHKLDDTLLFSGSYYDNDPIAAYKNILNNSATLNDKDKPVDVPVDPYKVLMGETIGSSNTSPYSEQFDESNFKNQNHYMNQDPLSSSNLYNSDGAISSTFPTTSVYAGNSDDPWKTADSLEIPPPKGVNINVAENNEPESDPYVSPGGEDYLLANDTIDVQTSNESSGHLFGHVTFIVTSKNHSSSVSRRYSDFLWIQEMLLKIYGFRIVTSLPPKKAVGMDNAFIERRRRGLLRFISFIGNHPVFSKDKFVIAFFTWETTLQNYRNSQPIFYDEEFLTLQLTEAMISGIPADLDDRITDFRKNLTNHTDLVCTMTNTLERFLIRLKESNADIHSLCDSLRKLSSPQECLLSNCRKCTRLEKQFHSFADGLNDVCVTNDRQTEEIAENIVESLKKYRDVLTGFQLLLQRRDMNIATLSLIPTLKRIQVNKNRIVEMTAKGVNQREIDRVNQLIDQDHREAEYQEARVNYLRYCVWTEFRQLHSQKTILSNLIHQSLQCQITHASEHLQLWSILSGSINEISKY
ncbi:hypothetical protein BC833DRAFT_578556 [Globomyces pollinis-pini]|nr:hypothetical protein BC833DRAFT_578556 [Globomyces pollinis-pini]